MSDSDSDSELAGVWSSSDTDSDDEAADARRARYKRLVGALREAAAEGACAAGPRRRPEKKRRQEARGSRKGRYWYQFPNGDERCRRLDPSKSAWWDLANVKHLG